MPWSQTVTDICEIGASLAHPSAVQIVEQRSLVTVKAILRKYEYKNYLATGREAERLLQFILLKGNEQGYKDVLEVNINNDGLG